MVECSIMHSVPIQLSCPGLLLTPSLITISELVPCSLVKTYS